MNINNLPTSRCFVALSFLLLVPAAACRAGEKVYLWPDGKMPDAQPQQIAAADGASNVAAAVVATVELVRTDQLISPTPVTPDPTESARKLYAIPPRRPVTTKS